MPVGEALRDLGRFLDDCEGHGTVTSVDLTGGDPVRAGALSTEVELSLSVNPSAGGPGAVSIRDATVAEDGTLRLAFESLDPVVPVADHGVDVDVTDVASGNDGTVTVTLSASVPVADGRGHEGDVASTDNESAGEDVTPAGPTRDREVPPFRDPELLASVYESCDTFAEMTEELGMDVTAETVRRYMVDHGIHEPNSYDTGDDESGADETTTETEPEPVAGDLGTDTEAEDETREQVVLADGIGLPDDVTVETLIETVKRSNTIYEVKQDIGVEHEDALEMLRELNLLDLVVGRLATEAERDISRDDVVGRLREASATR